MLSKKIFFIFIVVAFATSAACTRKVPPRIATFSILMHELQYVPSENRIVYIDKILASVFEGRMEIPHEQVIALINLRMEECQRQSEKCFETTWWEKESCSYATKEKIIPEVLHMWKVVFAHVADKEQAAKVLHSYEKCSAFQTGNPAFANVSMDFADQLVQLKWFDLLDEHLAWRLSQQKLDRKQ